MTLDLICARSGKGKSHLVYARAIERMSKGKKTIILVPPQFTLESEKALLKQMGEPSGMMDIMVMSINHLMQNIFNSVRRPVETIIDNKGKALALKAILKEKKDSLEIFGAVAQRLGFASSMVKLLDELKQYDVTGDMLSDALGDIDKDSTCSKKIKDIIMIINVFDEYSSEHNFMDESDALDFLCSIIKEQGENIKDYFEDCAVYVDGYDYMPQRYIRLMGSLIDIVEETVITATIDLNDMELDIFSQSKAFIESLEAYAFSNASNIRYITPNYTAVKKDKSILHLEKNLFSLVPHKYIGKSSIKITRAQGVYEEAQSTASKILHLINDKGYEFRDIGVICSDLEEYSLKLSRTFRQFKIPFFLDERRSVSSHPGVIWLLSAIECSAHFYRSDVINMIKTLYTPLNHEQCEELEDYCINNSIDTYLFKKPFLRGRKSYDLEKLNDMRIKALDGILSFDTDDKTASRWSKEIYALLNHYFIMEQLSSEKRRLERLARLDEAAQTAQTWNVIVETLEQLHFIVSDIKLSLDDVIRMLEEAFLDAKIGILPTGMNSVIIGDTSRSKLSAVRCIFLLGANDSMLPPQIKEGAILNDNELETLKQQGITAGKNAGLKRGALSCSLYTLMSSPRDELFISYNESGDRQRAVIIQRICRIFQDIEIERAQVDPFCCEAAAYSLIAKALGAIGDMRTIDDGRWIEVLSTMLNDDKYTWQIDKMYNFAFVYNDTYEILKKPSASIITSISQLEEYARCPFSYMVDYKIMPKDDPRGDVTPVSAGAFLHKLMEMLGKEISKLDITDLTYETVDELMLNMSKQLVKVFDDNVFTLSKQSEFYSNQLIECSRRGAKVYLRQIKSSDFRPAYHEMVFAFDGDLGAVEISLSDGKKAYLTGKIDRVDTLKIDDDTYNNTIDYKSGNKRIDISGILTGQSLQLFIYMGALTKNNDDKIGGVFYFPLTNEFAEPIKAGEGEKMDGMFVDDKTVLTALDTTLQNNMKSRNLNLAMKKDGSYRKTNRIVSPSYIKAAVTATQNTAAKLCEDIHSGRMPVSPIKDTQMDSCAYCSYNALCRFGTQNNDQRVKPSNAMIEDYILSFQEKDADDD